MIEQAVVLGSGLEVDSEVGQGVVSVVRLEVEPAVDEALDQAVVQAG